MRRKGDVKRRATAAARDMLARAVEEAPKDLELATEQAARARKIMLKHNVRFRWSTRRFICHGCKQLIVPGVNARVRIVKGVVLTTCGSCGYVNRKILAQP